MPTNDFLDEILANWLDDAMSTSLLSVSVDGYKGQTNPELIDMYRRQDYDLALDKAKQAIIEGVRERLPKKRMEAFSKGGLIPVDGNGRLAQKDIPWAANTGFNEALDQVNLLLNELEGEKL